MSKNPEILPKEKTLLINVESWNYRDFMEFGKAMRNDNVKALAMAQSIIVSWDYPTDPRADNALALLPIGEGAKVLRTIGQMIDAALEEMSTGDIAVDFTAAGWTFITMNDFNRAMMDGDYKKVQDMIYEVCTFNTLKKGDTLPLVEGVTAVKAIQKRYREILEGKF